MLANSIFGPPVCLYVTSNLGQQVESPTRRLGSMPLVECNQETNKMVVWNFPTNSSWCLLSLPCTIHVPRSKINMDDKCWHEQIIVPRWRGDVWCTVALLITCARLRLEGTTFAEMKTQPLHWPTSKWKRIRPQISREWTSHPTRMGVFVMVFDFNNDI